MSPNSSDRYFNNALLWDKYDPKRIVLDLIKPRMTVLDVGSSYGSFSEKLKNKGCVCDGVEANREAAQYSKQHHRNVYEIDLNNHGGFRQIQKTYDCITLLDVLEHVIDPEDVLENLHSKIKPGGLIYISVPNIVNIVERVNISMGRFNYREYGVLDRTHLRFFTRKTALSMVQGVFPDAKIVAVTPRIPQFKYLVHAIPTLFAMQFVIEARNS